MTGPRTLPEALADAAAGDEGYVFLDGRTERRRTFAQIHAAAARQAAVLLARGLVRGDLVAIVVAEPEAFLTALFAAALAGLMPASLSPPPLTGDLAAYLDRTAAILRVSRARAVMASTSLVAAITALSSRCPHLEMVLSVATELEDAEESAPGLKRRVSLDDVAFVQFTSGSTSQPKGVAVTHRSLAANIDAINGPSGLAASASDSAVSWLPLHHDMGLVGMALGALYFRRPAVLMTPLTFVKRPVEWLRAISRYRASVSFAPNFAYDLCVRRIGPGDLEGLDLSCWRVAGCGAEPIHAATLQAFAEAFRGAGFRERSFLPSYGLAEHVLAATFAPRDRLVRVESLDGRPVVSCGVPLPEHQLKIVDESHSDLSEGQVGEIVLAGPSVMRGYLGDDELTRETIRDGWLHTGDLGYLSGGELFVCGRTKDLIIVNGRKHHPQDLERAIDPVAGVRAGRAVAFATTRAGDAERVVMAVEPDGSVAPDALIAEIRQRVGDACDLFVHDVVLVPAGTIERTTSGKLQRFATKKRYEAGTLVSV